jgi:hypothetical protein
MQWLDEFKRTHSVNEDRCKHIHDTLRAHKVRIDQATLCGLWAMDINPSGSVVLPINIAWPRILKQIWPDLKGAPVTVESKKTIWKGTARNCDMELRLKAGTFVLCATRHDDFMQKHWESLAQICDSLLAHREAVATK